MTLKEVLNTIPDCTIINVYTEYDTVDDNNWCDYNKCEVKEIVPNYYNNKVSLSIYVDMPKVIPCELSNMAMIRALYEYIYYIREEYVDFEPDADMAEIYADMHAFWGHSDYTIDNTGRWYDANGDRIC
jgi:hypothetical protein